TCGTFGNCHTHSLLDNGEMIRIKRKRSGFSFASRMKEHSRANQCSSICESGKSVSGLNRSYLKTILPDRAVVSISKAPRIAIKHPLFPFWIRNSAELFTKKVNPGGSTETKCSNI